jgi:hypothetical protein
MKVINTLDGEPARTPTQIIRDWYAAYNDEMNWGGIDGFHATELMAALGVLFAAGPWCTDVENAEFTDGQEYLIEYTHPWRAAGITANIRGALFYVAEYDHFIHQCHGIITRDRLRAFATINQPETINDHP